jgi:hypothetical protein
VTTPISGFGTVFDDNDDREPTLSKIDYIAVSIEGFFLFGASRFLRR